MCTALRGKTRTQRPRRRRWIQHRTLTCATHSCGREPGRCTDGTRGLETHISFIHSLTQAAVHPPTLLSICLPGHWRRTGPWPWPQTPLLGGRSPGDAQCLNSYAGHETPGQSRRLSRGASRKPRCQGDRDVGWAQGRDRRNLEDRHPVTPRHKRPEK